MFFEIADNSEVSALRGVAAMPRGSALSTGVGVSEQPRRSLVCPMPDASFLALTRTRYQASGSSGVGFQSKRSSSVFT
jgi:hypothetical protein